MTGLTDYVAKHVIDHAMTGKTSIFSIPTVYIALFTAVGADDGTGFTEVSGSSYARIATAGSDWNAAAGTGPSAASNVNNLAFPTASGSWGTCIAFGGLDASSSGNLLWWDYLGNYAWLPATVNAASPGVLTVPAHGYSVSDSVVFSTEFGGVAPSFSASNFTGLLVLAHAATNTFDVTNAATQVNTSAAGNGMVRKVAAQSISSGVTASFSGGSPGQLSLSLA
jgi:hypothetical protein